MLKEMVKLIARAAQMNALASTDDAANIDSDDVTRLSESIESATEAIGRYDEQKRKTDEAICLLFRAVEVAADDYDGAMGYVTRAERLLGFASLEPAKT